MAGFSGMLGQLLGCFSFGVTLQIVRVLDRDLVRVRGGAGVAALGVRSGGLPDGQVHGFGHGIAGLLLLFLTHCNFSLPPGYRSGSGSSLPRMTAKFSSDTPDTGPPAGSQAPA